METTEKEKAIHIESPVPSQNHHSKWKAVRDVLVRVPRYVWMISIIFILIIIALIIYYETREYPHRYSRYDRPQHAYHVYHLDPYFSYWHMDNPFDRWDRYHDMIFDRQARLWDQIHDMTHTIRVSVPQNGQYTGTRIIGGDSLTYDIRVDSGYLTGTYSATSTGNLSMIGDKLKGLGYTLTASGNQYSFSGVSDHISSVLELFR